MSGKFRLFPFFLILIIKLLLTNGFLIKDILDESRKPFFFTQKEYKGMLEREAKEDVIKIPNMHTFKNNNTPNNYFKYLMMII